MRRVLIGIFVGCAIAMGLGVTTPLNAQVAKSVPTLQTKQQHPQNAEVALATVQYLTANGGKQQPRITHTEIAKGYALAHWLRGEAGGQALLKKAPGNSWKVVQAGGGAMNVQTLQGFGVPPDVALLLLKR